MSSQRGRKLRVLYVDPDEGTRERVRDAFEELSVTVDVTPDSEDALEHLAACRPACIVSEHDLPLETGISFLKSVRETYGEIPFVLFTGDGNERIASDAVTAGVSEYIPKTPHNSQLNQLVERVLDVAETQRTKDHLIEESLKDTAMDRAPAGITIADMRVTGEPLVYVNNAFERLTGYSASEALGQNCRFLQNGKSDQQKVDQMREAIENDAETAVELRNYTKDGAKFWNRVEIAPIRWEDGEATHYVGYQTDVTERKEAEIRAQSRAEQLEQKQAEFESLLERIEGLLQDVSEQVIHARTESTIKQQVCDAFVQANGYTLTWIGKQEPVEQEITVDAQAQSGCETGQGQVTPPTPLVERALSTEQVVLDSDNSDIRPETSAAVAVQNDTELPNSSLPTHAVVPVTYREATYGVVGICAEEDHQFDEHETIVLSTIGRIIGTALNAVQTQSMVQGDAVMELRLTVGPEESFVGVTSSLDCRLEHVGTISRTEDSCTVLFFDVEGAPPTEIVVAAERRQEVKKASVIRSGRENRGLIRLSVSSSPLVDVVVERGGTITDAVAEGRTGTVTVQLPKDTDPRQFVEEFKMRVPNAVLESYLENQRPQRTNQEFVSEVNAALTDRQRDALKTAYVSGFFDWPRRANGEDVAGGMGISQSTFHQHLRSAKRKLLEAFYDKQ
ncbi:bacterio-opsin activator domain-containing protein [Halovenus rubra]|uniref:Bacterio-opsin activator domain-containing protein n=2 Tax=Halovenus rubra TaxID=869890 RepID=A0ABD5XAH0_9EURY|nr:bacterio-opsin activator domain-containing protein [Halovenus rubra]